MNTELSTEGAIRFVETRQNHECSSEISQNWGGVIECLKCREKYENMWNDLKDLMDSTSVMDELEVKYFGSKPKTKHQRLNEAIDRLGVYMQVGRMSDIIELLVKLRDEEEDV